MPRPAALRARGAAPGDLREGGRWTLRQAAKNFVLACVLRAGFRIADRLPETWLVSLCRLSGHIAGRILRAPSARARRATATALPEPQASRVARACFAQAGEHLGLSLLLRRPGARPSRWVRLPETARRTLAQALERGSGAVFVSAHLGPFELLAAAIAEQGFRPSVVVRESYDPRLDAWVDAHRERHGVGVIHRGRSGAATRIVRALRSGRPVGFLPDLGGRVPGTPVQFLGGTMSFPVGPARIAQKTGAPLLVGWLRRAPLSGSTEPYEVEVVEVDASGEVDRVAQRVAGVLERAILEGPPEDWLWMASAQDRLQPVST